MISQTKLMLKESEHTLVNQRKKKKKRNKIKGY